MIKIEIDKKIISNYLNSSKSDQLYKNGQMLAIIYNLLERIEKIEKAGDKNGSSKE